MFKTSKKITSKITTKLFFIKYLFLLNSNSTRPSREVDYYLSLLELFLETHILMTRLCPTVTERHNFHKEDYTVLLMIIFSTNTGHALWEAIMLNKLSLNFKTF